MRLRLSPGAREQKEERRRRWGLHTFVWRRLFHFNRLQRLSSVFSFIFTFPILIEKKLKRVNRFGSVVTPCSYSIAFYDHLSPFGTSSTHSFRSPSFSYSFLVLSRHISLFSLFWLHSFWGVGGGGESYSGVFLFWKGEEEDVYVIVTLFQHILTSRWQLNFIAFSFVSLSFFGFLAVLLFWNSSELELGPFYIFCLNITISLVNFPRSIWFLQLESVWASIFFFLFPFKLFSLPTFFDSRILHNLSFCTINFLFIYCFH